MNHHISYLFHLYHFIDMPEQTLPMGYHNFSALYLFKYVYHLLLAHGVKGRGGLI